MANVGIFDLTDTWNAGGTTFNAIKMSVTDTASASGSLLLDLLVGGSSKFSVSKAGNTTLSGTLGVGGSDCILLREAANELAMRNGINAQTFRLYNTYTDASNYERGYLRWDADILKIGTEEEGSGTERAMELQTDGVTRMAIGATGRVGIGTTTPLTLLHVSGAGASNAGTILLDDPVTPTGSTSSGPHFYMKSGGVNRGWIGFFDAANHGNGTQLNLKAAGDIGFANGTPSANAMTLTGGSLGIGTTVPGRRLDVNDASGNCLRLTHNDADGSATNFCDLLVSSGGDLTIDPSGGDVTIDGTVETAAPTGGTAAKWKLGTVASVSPTSPDRTIEVEIGGTTYYLAAKTTND